MRFRATLYHTVTVFVLRLAGKSPDMDFFFGQIIEIIGEFSIAIVWMVSLYIYIQSLFLSFVIYYYGCFIFLYLFISFFLFVFLSLFNSSRLFITI